MLKELIKRYSHINWVLADQAMVSGVNFLTGILIARFLGIEEFGVFTLVWMAVLFVNSIQMAMISSPMMTIGPKQSEEDKGSYYGAVVLQQFIFSILTSLMLWMGVIFSDLINPEWGVSHLALPLALALFFFQNQDFLRRLLFTENRASDAFASDVVSYLGRIAILLALFIGFQLNTDGVLWVIALTSALAVVLGWYQLDALVFRRNQLLPVFKRHWVLSKWMTASAVMQWTSGNYFVLAAGTILGPVAVGALKAAQNIIGITHILFQGLENIVPATASRYFKSDGVNGLKKYLIKVALWGGGVTMAIALAVSIFPGALLGVVYGEQYTDYGNVLRWYALCYMLMFFSLPLRSGLRVLEASRPIFIAYALMTIFSILFAGVLVDRWGVNGVGVGILGTQIISVSCVYYFLKTHLKRVIN